MQIFVIDTSVFLSNPKALSNLVDKNIVIPMVVLLELESKRNDPDLGYAAREVLRKLEEYRKTYGSLASSIETPFGGSIKIELNHMDDSALPKSAKSKDSDGRILAVAYNLKGEGSDVTLLTKDLPLRLRASVVGIESDDFGVEEFSMNEPTLQTVTVDASEIDSLYETGSVRCPVPDSATNSSFVLKSGSASAMATLSGDGNLKLVEPVSAFGIQGRSAEQKIALSFLRDRNIPIVSISGRSGSGKSLMALASGLEETLENNHYDRILVFRPLYPVGGQELGYLPGDSSDKMEPWTAAVFDTLKSFCNKSVIDHIISEKILEVLPLTHIRGRTLDNSFIIIDEAQQLEKMVLLTALSRLGRGSKAVLTYDIDQRDNLKVGKYDGVAAVSNTLKGNKLFAHIALQKSERSEVAELVSTILNG